MVNHNSFKLNHVIILGNKSFEDARSSLIEQLAKGRGNKQIGFPSSVLVFQDNSAFQRFMDAVKAGWNSAGRATWAAGPPKQGVGSRIGTKFIICFNALMF